MRTASSTRTPSGPASPRRVAAAACSLASYLSGLVIGEELRVQPAVSGAVIVAAPALARRYAIAIPGARVLGDEATWQGLRAIARSLAT